MQHFLFLSSSDTNHPGNLPGDFTVTLPKTYDLKGCWECALLEISLSLPYYQRLSVCCDVIQDSCFHGTLYPVLRIIPEVQDNGTHLYDGDLSVYGHLTFDSPYFFQIRKKELGRLRIL